MPDPAAAISAAPVEAPTERPDFPGIVTSKVSKIVPAEFQGRLEKVFVHQRQRVKAGEIVAKLDPSELQAEIDTLRAQESGAGSSAGAAAAAAASAAQQAKTECRLYNRGFGSRNACTAATLRAAEARGQIGAAGSPGVGARARRKQLEEQIRKAELPSPIDGVITITKGKEGDIMQRGIPLFRVFDDRDLVIKFALPKEHKNLVKIGGRVELRVAGVEQPIWANITTISDEEPPITFAVVEADIDDTHLRPGEIQVASEGRVRIADAAPPSPNTVSVTPAPTPAAPAPATGANP